MERREQIKEEKVAKTRSGGKPRRGRSSWPKPDLILSLLPQYSSIRELCRQLSINYYVVACYRKEDPLFAAEYDRIIAEQETQKIEKNPNYGAISRVVNTDDWKERFLHEYAKTFKKEAARIYAGVEAAIVEDALDPASTEYDKAFAERLRSIQISRKWTVEDTLWDMALNPLGEADKRTQSVMFRDLLRIEFPESFGRQSVIVNNGAIVGISEGAGQKAVALLKELFEEREVKEIPIDVEFEEVKSVDT